MNLEVIVVGGTKAEGDALKAGIEERAKGTVDTATVTCKGCGKVIPLVDGRDPTDNAVYGTVPTVQVYCSNRCYRRHQKNMREREYQHRDNLSIFDVEGV